MKWFTAAAEMSRVEGGGEYRITHTQTYCLHLLLVQLIILTANCFSLCKWPWEPLQPKGKSTNMIGKQNNSALVHSQLHILTAFIHYSFF